MGILVLAGRSLSATELIRLAAPLRLSATNVKSHLTRMVLEGALEREGPARLATYHASAGQRLVMEGIQARLAPQCDEPWDGNWLMLTLQPPADRGERDRLRAALWCDGWRPVGPFVVVRPAWPPRSAEMAARLYAEYAPGFCFSGECLSGPAPLEALYDLDGLDARARRLAAWIRAKGVSPKSPKAAFVARMRVGGRVAQFAGHDPHLPPALWGERRGMREMVEAFRQFEECVAPASRIFLDG
jgi:DNA-binding transcriptional regulator PaaX